MKRPHRLNPLNTEFTELSVIEEVLGRIGGRGRIDILDNIETGSRTFPIYCLRLGPEDPTAPVLGIFAGVHGLEKVGTHVAISYMQTVAGLLQWDELFQQLLEHVRVIIVPLVNPGGMYLSSRSNPQGIDLMRNAPVEGEKISRFSLLSGHRLSPRLPWYRGPKTSPMQREAQAVCNLVRSEFYQSRFAISIDVHSGFGLRDRIWFPYAKTKRPFPHLAEIFALKNLLKGTFPNHVYRVEPQCLSYTTHGDLWDYLYDEHYRERSEAPTYLPLSLEMGSWLWVKKNPLQLFSSVGPFNPMKPHRYQRTMRRHLSLFDFLGRAVHGYQNWQIRTDQERNDLQSRAINKWFQQSVH